MMVSPDHFAYDVETEGDNAFQSRPAGDPGGEACREFAAMARTLEDAGVRVEVRPAPPGCPDAVFPNNWFSTHEDGTLCLYPMRAESRRRERAPDTVAWLRERWPRLLDLTEFERDGEFLEGTGSLVLDREARVAFAAPSPRTHPRMVELWCEQSGYQPVFFDALGPDGRAVYHTNVVLGLGEGWAVLAEEAVPEAQRGLLRRILRGLGKETVAVGWEAACAMACNVLELQGADGPVVVAGSGAAEALGPEGREALGRHARLLPVEVGTFEAVGGGGARCMLAELFLPRGAAGM